MQNSLKKILVVDDEDASRYTVCRYLRAAEFEVWEAKTGRQALELVKKMPSLVVLDIGLPDILGLDVCREIKTNPQTASIPILHTSATFTTTRDITTGLEGGADGYLTAPVEPDELIATVRSLLRMRDAEAQAHRFSRQWQTTFDAISDGICLVSDDGKVQRHNRAFAALFARADSNFVGRSLLEILEAALPAGALMPKLFQTRGREVSEANVSGRFLRIAIEPVADGAEFSSAAVCILQDVTAEKSAENELKKAQFELQEHAADLENTVAARTSELQESVRSLQTFYYSIAHDLQAPLRNIQSFMTLLRDNYGERVDETGRNYFQRVLTSSARMQVLIKDLLAYGQVSHAKFVLNKTDLSQTVAEAQEILRAKIMQKNAEIRVEGGGWPKVWASSSLLNQVLVNLLENGLKFVEAGVSPKIVIQGRSEGEYFCLWFEDNGIGISPEHHNRIFHIFERLHSNESTFSGTGIGLAIARKAMERMGGQVGVESKGVNGGSKFWLKFKLASATCPEPALVETEMVFKEKPESNQASVAI